MAREKGTIGQLYILSGHLVRVTDLWKIAQELFSLRSLLINIPLKLARFVAYFAELFYKLTQKKPKLTRYSIDTLQSNAVINNMKAQEYLGYRIRPVHETIRDTMDWWKQNLELLKKTGNKKSK